MLFIMTELGDKIIKPLINDNTIKFFGRYVDDTLLLFKHQDVHSILSLLNSFDLFENEVLHLLDLELSTDCMSIFRKNTNTG